MIPYTLTGGLAPARAVLENGVILLAQESGETPAIAVNATFYTGSLNDPPGLPGVAYLTRRTIDRGTTGRSANAIAETLDDRGVSLRVSVSRHAFTLSCVCLSEDFEEILGLLVDVARNPVFPEDEIEKRRLQAVTTVREDLDDTARVAADALQEMLYGAVHPYGRPLKGTVESLQGISRGHLVDFHARHIVPSALRLVVAGDVTPSTVLGCASRAIGDWRRPPPVHEPVPPPLARARRAVRSTAMPGKSQADIAYGFTTIRRADPRYYAYWMMNNVLGQFGLGGRLADNIRERQGMAYYACSTLDPTVGEGPLMILAGVDPVNVDRTIAAIDDEVRALGESGPTRAELEETRESLIGSIPRLVETNESIADFLQHIEHFGLGLDYDRRLPALLGDVTPGDVSEACRAVLDPARAAISVAGPPG